MSDMNQCNFTGRLGQDPEVKFLPSGDAVANLRFAVGKQWKDKQGQKQEKTNWITLVAFGKTAEIIQQWVKKGDQLRVTCEMQVREWDDQSGNKRYSTDFVIRDMQMLGSPQGRQQGQQGGYQQQSPGQQGAALYGANQQGQQQGGAPQSSAPQGGPPPGGFDDFDDEIPFMRKNSYEGG